MRKRVTVVCLSVWGYTKTRNGPDRTNTLIRGTDRTDRGVVIIWQEVNFVPTPQPWQKSSKLQKKNVFMFLTSPAEDPDVKKGRLSLIVLILG